MTSFFQRKSAFRYSQYILVLPSYFYNFICNGHMKGSVFFLLLLYIFNFFIFLNNTELSTLAISFWTYP